MNINKKIHDLNWGELKSLLETTNLSSYDIAALMNWFQASSTLLAKEILFHALFEVKEEAKETFGNGGEVIRKILNDNNYN